MEALIQAADGNGSELSQSFSLIPQGSPVLLEKTSGLALLQSSFSLNAQGKIEIASSRQAKNAALLLANGIPFQYAKVTAGQELQLYVDSTIENLQVLVNGKTVNAEMKQDSLGQTYIPLKAAGRCMNIEVLDSDLQEPVFESAVSVSNPGLLILPVSALGALTAALCFWMKGRSA